MSSDNPDPTNMSHQSDSPVSPGGISMGLPIEERQGMPGVYRIPISAKRPRAGRPYYHESCELISATVDGKPVPLPVLFIEGSFKGCLYTHPGYMDPDAIFFWVFWLKFGSRTKISTDDRETFDRDLDSAVLRPVTLTFRHRFIQHYEKKSKPTSILEAMVYEDEEVLDEQFTALLFHYTLI
ncbi:hypothetical protein CC79DRAFT_1322759 [Sarocladium strictum]